MNNKKLKMLKPKKMSPKEQVAVAVLREIILWGRDYPEARTEFDPVRQYEKHVIVFNKIAVRELKSGMSNDADEALAQLNMTEEMSSRLLEAAGIGYPLPITDPPPRYI